MAIAFCKYVWAARAIFYRFRFGHIGKKCYIGKPIFLAGTKNIFFDEEVRIYPGCRLETFGEGKIEIQKDVSIGQNFHCTSAGNLVIGKSTTILGNTFITNIDHEYQNIEQHLLRQPMLIKETTIGENCFIGYGVAIQAGTKLGKQCVVGANSVVRGEFPDYCVIVGAPARIVKRYNTDTKKWERIDGNK